MRYFSNLSLKAMLGACAIAALPVAAQAADYGAIPMAEPMVRRAAEVVTEYASNWYLRGDVGYRSNNKVGSTAVISGLNATSNDLGEAFAVGLGAGYSAGWFRADATIDWGGQAKYRGDRPGTAGYFNGRIDAMTALANVYIDMGTWGGLTPYIGAGVGAALVRADEFANLGIATTTPIQTTSHWNVAWAYMAGVSYRISNNFLIDVGYRHLNLGEARTGYDSNNNRLTIKDLASDEIRVGARYQID